MKKRKPIKRHKVTRKNGKTYYRGKGSSAEDKLSNKSKHAHYEAKAKLKEDTVKQMELDGDDTDKASPKLKLTPAQKVGYIRKRRARSKKQNALREDKKRSKKFSGTKVVSGKGEVYDDQPGPTKPKSKSRKEASRERWAASNDKSNRKDYKEAVKKGVAKGKYSPKTKYNKVLIDANMKMRKNVKGSTKKRKK